MILRDNPGIDVIRQVLPEHLGVDVLDDVLVIRGGELRWVVRPTWIGEGFPGDLHRADSLPEAAPHDAVEIVTARRMSSGAVKLLNSAGRSWADASGQAQIIVPPGLVIERRVLTKSEAPTAKAFSVSTRAVIEAILSMAIRDPQPDARQRVFAGELSEVTGYSYPQVNKVLQELESRGYIEKHGAERGVTAERTVRDHSRLLSEWAGGERQIHPLRHHLHSVNRDPHVNIDSINRAFTMTGNDKIGMIDWVATGWLAADHIAPFATSVPDVACSVRRSQVDAAVSRLTHDANMESVDAGGRVTITAIDDVTWTMRTSRDGIPCASPIRVYADLLRIGGRGEEAAEHLREVAIGF